MFILFLVNFLNFSFCSFNGNLKKQFISLYLSNRQQFLKSKEVVINGIKQAISIHRTRQTEYSIDNIILGKSDDHKKSKRDAKSWLLEYMSTGTIQEIREAHLKNILSLKTDKLKVLSIDGGGIKGIVALVALRKLEEDTGRKVCEIFDYVIGTSTGGLISLLLTVPNKEGKIFTAGQVLKLYLDKCGMIFSRILNPSPYSPKYSGKGLKQIVYENFGEEVTLADAVIPVGVVHSLKYEKRAMVTSSAHAVMYPTTHNTFVVSCVRGTSAAPTYFPGSKLIFLKEYKERLTHEMYLVTPKIYEGYLEKEKNAITKVFDGGLHANNPAKLGYQLALYIYKNSSSHPYINGFDNRVLVVSFGTGTKSGKDQVCQVFFDKNQGEIVAGTVAVQQMADGTLGLDDESTRVQEELESILGYNLIRLQFKVEDDEKEMDNIEETNLNMLLYIGEQLCQQDQLNEMISRISGSKSKLNRSSSRFF